MPKLNVEYTVNLKHMGLKLIPPFTLIWEKDDSKQITISYPTLVSRGNVKAEIKNVSDYGLTAKQFIEKIKECR